MGLAVLFAAAAGCGRLPVHLASGGGAALAQADAQPLPSAVARGLAHVPARVLDRVGMDAALSVGLTAEFHQAPLMSGGKPEVFFEGAEFCPHCAANSWALVIALSRFGRFSKLGWFRSAANFADPHTPGVTYYGASYGSPYVAFAAVEYTTPRPRGKFYVILQKPTPAEAQLLSRADPGGGVPFADFGNQFALSGATYNPALLAGLTPQQIAADAADPTNPVGRAIDASANLFAALVCAIDDGRPVSVCQGAGVRAASPYLTGKGPGGA